MNKKQLPQVTIFKENVSYYSLKKEEYDMFDWLEEVLEYWGNFIY